ncbi:MAG: hypothetical protein ACI9PZ_002467, partial [Parvicella sp.]
MALTDIQCRNAKPKDKPYKLFDSEGLYLYVPASGKKVWRFKYRFNTKEGLITIDKYQNLNLKEARKVRNSFISELA